MKLELLLAYRNLDEFIKQGAGEEAWNQTMIMPYWDTLAKWAPFPVDYMKPSCNLSEEQAKEQLELLDQIDWEECKRMFEQICSKLPKDDEDTMYVAIYPSMTDMPEGIVGAGVWGNIILNINPYKDSYKRWLPFVFAHEYHHCVWGDYWYGKRGGEGLKDIFLENIITEGEADAFAKSIVTELVPSWHLGVDVASEKIVWEKMKEVLHKRLEPKERARYMFGNDAIGIPCNAGYYYGIRIVEKYLKKNPDITFLKLIEVAPESIYEKSLF